MLFPYENIDDPVERTRKLVFAYQHVLWPAFFALKNDTERRLAASFVLSKLDQPDHGDMMNDVGPATLPLIHRIRARIKGFGQARGISQDEFDIHIPHAQRSTINSAKQNYKKRLKQPEFLSLMGAKINNDDTQKLLDYFDEGIVDEEDLLILTLASSIMRKEAFKVFVEFSFLSKHNTLESMAKETGVTKKQIQRHYSQNIRRLKAIIDKFFPAISGHISLQPKKTSPTFAETAGLLPDLDKMNLAWNSSIEDLFLIAENEINSAELFCLCAVYFYNAQDKMTLQNR